MKSRIRFFLIIFILFEFSGCKNDKHNEYDYLNDTLEKIHMSLNNYSIILVIPNEGCSGCIKEATQYAIEKVDAIDKETTAVIFTGIGDMKLFKLHVDNSFLVNRNVFIDDNNYFMNSEVSSVYPQTIKLKNRKVISKEVFDRSTFDNLLLVN